jgi:hypothetical protein
MDQQHKPTETQPKILSLDSLNESDADLTQICWTQWLREAVPEMVGPQLPLPPLPKNFVPEDLFK